MAVGVLQECLKLGVAIPAEMAISGFHGLDIGQATTPILASVTTPRFEMGKVAAEILIKKIKKSRLLNRLTCIIVSLSVGLSETKGKSIRFPVIFITTALCIGNARG